MCHYVYVTLQSTQSPGHLQQTDTNYTFFPTHSYETMGRQVRVSARIMKYIMFTAK